MSLEASSSDDTPPLRDILGVLDDEGCRDIIVVLEAPMTAPEIAEAADLPLSSTYRKLDRLTDSRLVTETVGLREGRHRTSRYVLDFDRLSIRFDDERKLQLEIDHGDSHTTGLWSDVTSEF